MSQLVTNGAKIFYQQFGAGPDVVLIHGLAANRAFWFLHALQALKPYYRVTIYDLRGHGYSSMPGSAYTSADMAEDLGGLVNHLGISNPVLIGHSFGGVVALQYATRYPDRVRGVVLADSRVHALQPAQRLEDQPELQPIEDALMAESDVDWRNEAHVGLRLLEEFARNKVSTGTLGGHHEFVPFGAGQQGGRSARRWLKLLDTTTARDDFRAVAGLTVDRIASFDRPVGLIYGERSRCMESCRKLQHVMPSCDTIVVPGVGHFHPITRPRLFNAAVLEFLDRATTYDVAQGQVRVRDARRPGAPDRRWADAGHGAHLGPDRRTNGERRTLWLGLGRGAQVWR